MTDRNDRDPILGKLIDGLQDRPPDRDLWPMISHRLRPRAWWRRREIGIAAALLVLFGGSLATAWLLRPASPEAQMIVQGSPAAGTDTAVVLPVGYVDAEQALVEATDIVEAKFAELADRLDPEARAALDEALAVLDSAINRARVRAGESPDDLRTAADLTSMMRRKLGVLNRVTVRLSRS